MCYTVFSEDYKKIVNIEELAEQSVDEMQAYLLLQDKVNETLEEAFAKLDRATKDFAAKYNVTLVEDAPSWAQKWMWPVVSANIPTRYTSAFSNATGKMPR